MAKISLKHTASTAISSPTSGSTSLFYDTDGKLKQKDENGIVTEIGSGTTPGSFTIPLSNTVWINQDLETSDETNRVFNSYTDAIAFVQEQSPSASNQWQIVLPGGLIDLVTLYQYIPVTGNDSTIIGVLKSSVLYESPIDTFSAYISGVQIQSIELDAGTCCSIFNSVVLAASAEGIGYIVSNDTIFFSIDYTNLVNVAAHNTKVFATTGAINGSYNSSIITCEDCGDVNLFSCDLNIRNTENISGNISAKNSHFKIKTGTVLSGTTSICNSSFEDTAILISGNSTFEQVKYHHIIVLAEGTLTTKNCTGEVSNSSGGSWTNTGHSFDNSTFGGAHTLDSQSALDYLYNLIAGKDVLVNIPITVTYAIANAYSTENNFVAGDTITISLGETTETFTFVDTYSPDPTYEIIMDLTYEATIGNMIASLHNTSALVDVYFSDYPIKLIFISRFPGTLGNETSIVFSNPLPIYIQAPGFSGGAKRYIINLDSGNRFELDTMTDDVEISFVKSDSSRVSDATIKITQDEIGGHSLTYANDYVLFTDGIELQPTQTANSVDIFRAYHEGSNNFLFVSKVGENLKESTEA